jgi:hypothetical protein
VVSLQLNLDLSMGGHVWLNTNHLILVMLDDLHSLNCRNAPQNVPNVFQISLDQSYDTASNYTCEESILANIIQQLWGRKKKGKYHLSARFHVHSCCVLCIGMA